MRNIEALKDYFLGKDPQLKETMADNSLRLIGIPGRYFVLRTELLSRLKTLRDELLKKDKELSDKIDEAIQEIEELSKKIPFTTLTADLHIYQDQPMNPLWESGWYNTGEYKVYWADTVEPIAFEHTLFYYNNAPGETYLEFMPETFVDNWNLLKLFLYWDEDEQEWFPDSIGIDEFIAENSSGIPTSSAVRHYVQNNVVHHLQAPVAAASDLSQGLYVADSDLRFVTAYEQVQLYSGDFIVVETGTSPIDTYMIVIGKDSTRVLTYTNGHLYETTYAYKQNPIGTLTEDLDVSNNLFTLDEGIYYSGSHVVKYYDSQLADYVAIVPQNALFFYSAAYSTFETLNLSELGIPDLIVYKHKWDNDTSKWVPYIYTYTAFEGTDGNTAGTKGLVPAPATTDAGKFLKSDGTWATAGGGGTSDYDSLSNRPSINSVTLTGNKTAADLSLNMVVLSYGSSTWAEFLAAYTRNAVIYCRASSSSNPGSGTQSRMAFLAYVDNPTTPAKAEFQYYRSISTKSAANQGDEVFIYTLNSDGTWTVGTRKTYTRIMAGTNMSETYSSGVLTLNASVPITASDTDIGVGATLATGSYYFVYE